MSFILDALKKLEHQRRQESIPDLTTIHEGRHHGSNRKNIRFYVVVFVLILNAAVIGFVLYPTEEGSRNDNSRSAAVNRNEESRSSATEETIADTNSTAENLSVAGVPESLEREDSKPVDTHKGDAKSRINNTGQDKSIKKASDTGASQPKEKTPLTDAALPFRMDDQKIRSLRKKIEQEHSAYIVTGKELDSEYSVPSKIKEEHHVPGLDRLPEETRNALPEITINGHVFSDNPSARIANINGKIVHEEENIANGLKVEEITFNGIIFNYKGSRFRMRAF